MTGVGHQHQTGQCFKKKKSHFLSYAESRPKNEQTKTTDTQRGTICYWREPGGGGREKEREREMGQM
jgi:N-methylhydantoinase B/oxoprolinase/acetone carboxylase alpha subunit